MIMRPHLLLAIAVASSTLAACAEDWPQFRGPGGRAISGTANPPIGFGPTSNLVWKVAIPDGISSPVVTGGRIFLTAKTDDRIETLGVDRKDGRILWRQRALADKPDKTPDPANGGQVVPTPITDGKFVYVFFGSIGLIAYDLDGKEQWRQPLTTTDLETSSSPILIDDKLVIVCDRPAGSFVEAHDKKTGGTLWRAERPQFRRGRATPIHWVHGRDTELVVAGSSAVTSYNPLTGAENWRFTGTARFAAGSPTASENLLFSLSTRDPIGESPTPAGSAEVESVLVALRPGGSGDITETHLAWKTTHSLPYGSSPLFYKGRLFTVNDGGLLSAYDEKDGHPIYQDEHLNPTDDYWSSAVAAAGRIYLTSYEGHVTVINATAATPAILAQNNLDEKMLATPALVDENIIFRSTKSLYCFGVK